jgi:hypothetical protein
MCMQVNIHLQLFVLVLLYNRLFDRPYSRLFRLRWLYVVPIKILSKCIEPVIAPDDSIRVKHRDDLEDKLVTQDLSLNALLISQKLEDAIEHE